MGPSSGTGLSDENSQGTGQWLGPAPIGESASPTSQDALSVTESCKGLLAHVWPSLNPALSSLWLLQEESHSEKCSQLR